MATSKFPTSAAMKLPAGAPKAPKVAAAPMQHANMKSVAGKANPFTTKTQGPAFKKGGKC